MPEPEAPKEQPVDTKEEAFKKDPDRFADTHAMIVAVGRSDKGPTLFMNAKTRIELTNALGEVSVALHREIMEFDNRKKASNPNKIITFARSLRR